MYVNTATAFYTRMVYKYCRVSSNQQYRYQQQYEFVLYSKYSLLCNLNLKFVHKYCTVQFLSMEKECTTYLVYKHIYSFVYKIQRGPVVWGRIQGDESSGDEFRGRIVKGTELSRGRIVRPPRYIYGVICDIMCRI